jgi:hypothetical protein
VTIHNVLSCIFVVVIAMLVCPDYLGTVFYVLRSTALEGFNYCGSECRLPVSHSLASFLQKSLLLLFFLSLTPIYFSEVQDDTCNSDTP